MIIVRPAGLVNSCDPSYAPRAAGSGFRGNPSYLGYVDAPGMRIHDFRRDLESGICARVGGDAIGENAPRLSMDGALESEQASRNDVAWAGRPGGPDPAVQEAGTC